MTDKAVRLGDPPVSRRSRPVWPPVLFLVLVVVSALLHVEKHRRGHAVQKAKADVVAMVSARPIDKVKAERTRFYETQFFLGYPTSVSYAVADFVRRCNVMARPLRLLDVLVDAGLQDFRFRLTVGVEAAGPEAAWRKFAVFFREFRELPGITQASYSVPRRDDGLHVFSVSGQAEWQ
jgi:hypothetical protein